MLKKVENVRDVSTTDDRNSGGIGARVRRREDDRHLRGRGEFTSDIFVPNTMEVAFVRSPIAHGRIRGIKLPDRYAGRIFTASELPDARPIRAVPEIPGFKESTYPVLATDKVRFVGEVVAVCLGTTRYEAEDVAASVELDLEELPAVTDVHRALGQGSALLHEHWGDNVFVTRDFESGEVDRIAREAPIAIRRKYVLNRQAGVPMEGRAILAYWNDRLDELVVYNSSQFPHQIRAGMAACLGIEETKLHLIAPDVGGGFGVKNVLYPEEVVVAALARKLKTAVRWIEDRREHLLSSLHCRQTEYEIAAYADARGKLLALDVAIIVDAGAYSHWPNSPFLETGMAIKNVPGPYAIRHYRAKTLTVATNKSPLGPYRGVARPGACFAIERTVDEIARAVGREPHEVRIDNMIRADEMPYRSVTDLLYDNGDYAQSVSLAAELVDLPAVRSRQRRAEPDGRLIGVGFASFTEQTAHGCGEWATRGTPVIPGFESATARMLPDGTLLLLVGIQSHGQGLETALAQVACTELGIDIAHVAVRHGDTTVSPFGMGTFASRSMVMAGGAVAKACRSLRARVARIASSLLECSPEQLKFTNSRAVAPRGSLAFREIAHIAYLRQDKLPPGVSPMLDVTETYEPAIATGVFCYATHAAVIAVDPETGHIEILDYGVVEDCGTIVNPINVMGQITGGVAQGIGTALYEEIVYADDGQPLTTTFADYLMPGATEIPPIKIRHLVTPAIHTEYGMKGMGEGGAISPPAAIANALRDALVSIDAELNEVPLSPRRVRAAITAARGKRSGERRAR
jgi:carbon-monoxide dehydrogenase large subunit